MINFKKNLICFLALTACFMFSNVYGNPQKEQLQNKYLAGSTTIFIHEKKSVQGFDPAGGITGGVRVLPTEIWYPVDKSQQNLTRASYSDFFFGSLTAFQNELTNNGASLADSPGYYKPGTTMEEYNAAVVKRFNSLRDSFLDAPISKKGPFPVVILVHGDADHRSAFNKIGEWLAQSGYIAIAFDITGNAGVSQVGKDPNYPAENVGLVPLDADGSYTPQVDAAFELFNFTANIDGASGVLLFDILEEYRLDVQTIINKLPEFNRRGFLEGKIDLDRIGYSGQSLGSILGRICLGTNPKIKAGFFYVPVGEPDFTHVFLQAEQLTGVDYLSQVSENKSWLWVYNHIAIPESKPAFYFLHGEDEVANFFDNLYSDPAFIDVPPTIENPTPDAQRAFLYGTGPSFYSVLARANHNYFLFDFSTQSLLPEIAQLTYPEVFNPAVNYQLLPVEKGFNIARSKMVAFMDVYVKGNAKAKKELLSQKFKKNLLFEFRNENE